MVGHCLGRNRNLGRHNGVVDNVDTRPRKTGGLGQIIGNSRRHGDDSICFRIGLADQVRHDPGSPSFGLHCYVGESVVLGYH